MSTLTYFLSPPPRYLQEVGYTDTVLDVKSQRVRALLGLTRDSTEKPSEKKTEPMVNGTEVSSLKDSGMVRYHVTHRKTLYSNTKTNHSSSVDSVVDKQMLFLSSSMVSLQM